MSLGSTHLVMDDGGAIAQGLSFDPFGRRRSDGAGLVHMNGPVYDPTLGRFISADPFIQAPNNTQSHNRYSYVLNNPLSYTDPSGYEAVSLLAGGIVAAVIVTSAAAQARIEIAKAVSEKTLSAPGTVGGKHLRKRV